MTSKFETLDQVKALLSAEAEANGDSLAIVYAKMYGYCSVFLTEREAKAILKSVKEKVGK